MVEQQAEGRDVRTAVDHFTVTNHRHGRAAALAGEPHATDQGCPLPVVRQGVFYVQLQRVHGGNPRILGERVL